jgi:glycosyltransferase involved in cell wall biosynthesis
MDNRVSVVIPTYNRSGLVTRAIDSVLAATSGEDEVIVVDDGSTDDTASAVRRFGDAVRYVRIDNAGPGAARNVGIRMARSPLVAFLDSDDTWMPDKVELQRGVMAAFPSLLFCFGNMQATFPGGEVHHDLLSLWRSHARIGSDWAPCLSEALGPGVRYSSFARLPEGRADFDVHFGNVYAAEMDVHYVCSDAVMVRKELAGDLLRYPENIRLMEDYECFARLSKAGPGAYLDCELANLHEHAGPRLTAEEDIRHLTARIDLLRRVWGEDLEFLATHSLQYERTLTSKLRLRSRLLITSGRADEARDDIKAWSAPWSYRMVASLPPGVVHNMLRAKRALRALVTPRS